MPDAGDAAQAALARCYAAWPRVRLADDPAVVVDTRADVRAALARLSVEHRRVLVLRYFADFTERQVSAVLDIRGSTRFARTRQHRPQNGVGDSGFHRLECVY